MLSRQCKDLNCTETNTTHVEKSEGDSLNQRNTSPKNKKPKINRRKKKKRKYLVDRKMCRKRNRIEGSDSHGIQNCCTPLLSPSLFSVSPSLDTHPQTIPNLSSLRGGSETGLGRIRVRGRGEDDDVRVPRRVRFLIRLRNNLTVGYFVCHPDLQHLIFSFSSF